MEAWTRWERNWESAWISSLGWKGSSCLKAMRPRVRTNLLKGRLAVRSAMRMEPVR